jgi:hypothetical protein
MRNRLFFVVSVVVLLGLVNSASASIIELKVDFAYPPNEPDDPCARSRWEATKAGDPPEWYIWASPGWRDVYYHHDAVWAATVSWEDPCDPNKIITILDPNGMNNTGINAQISTGYSGDTGLSVYDLHVVGDGEDPCGTPKEDPICNSEITSPRKRGAGMTGRDGSVLLKLIGLAPGEWMLKSYHNDLVYLEETEILGIPCDPLDPRVMPSIAVTGDGVIQTQFDYDIPIQQEISDGNLTTSVVMFENDSSDEVEVEYVAVPLGWEYWGAAAVLNAFELYGVPSGTAYGPNVPDGTTNVHPDPNVDPNRNIEKVNSLIWKPGAYAVHHEVYFGTDEAAVFNATDPNVLPGRGRQDPCSYTPPARLDLDTTYYWRIDEANDAHPNSPWKGKVWSFKTADGKASGPTPGNDSTDADMYTTALKWSAGVVAAQHDVYFGTDEAAVFSADNPDLLPGRGRRPKDPCTYAPGVLEFGKTYYWRIDEVNSLFPIAKGDVWRFTAINYFVVDDMEDYDEGEDRINYTWLDGYPDYSGSEVALGSIHGKDEPVHDGNQSMIYYYDNNMACCPNYSEIEASTSELGLGSNWTVSGVETLVVFFHGDPNEKNESDANDTEQMYLGVRDSANKYAEVRYGDNNNEDMNDIKIDDWQEWNIRLQDFTDINGVYLGNIEKVYIGFGDRENPVPGGSGLVFFDDLRLYLPRCVPSLMQPEFDLNNDCIVDYRDANIMATDWLQGPCVEVSPPDANGLLVEYLFDTDFSDTSGNGYHGLPSGPNAVVSDGNLVLTGKPDSYMDIPLAFSTDGNNPFDGTMDYSIQMTFASPNDSQVLLGSARPGATKLDRPMIFFVREEPDEDEGGNPELSVHFWYDGGADANGTVDVNDGAMHTVVVSYNALTRTADFYTDGYDDGTNKPMRYGMVYINQHQVRIGSTVCASMMSDMDVENFRGAIDSIRIYDYPLSQTEAAYLATNGTGIRPIISAANFYDEESPAHKTINFMDFAVFAEEEWLAKTYWP